MFSRRSVGMAGLGQKDIHFINIFVYFPIIADIKKVVNLLIVHFYNNMPMSFGSIKKSYNVAE